MGSVIGNAIYDDFLVICQNVTVQTGTTVKLGQGVFLGPGAKVVGAESVVGNRVSIGVNATVYNSQIADDSVVVCEPGGGITVRDRIAKECRAQYYFRTQIVP